MSDPSLVLFAALIIALFLLVEFGGKAMAWIRWKRKH